MRPMSEDIVEFAKNDLKLAIESRQDTGGPADDSSVIPGGAPASGISASGDDNGLRRVLVT